MRVTAPITTHCAAKKSLRHRNHAACTRRRRILQTASRSPASDAAHRTQAILVGVGSGERATGGRAIRRTWDLTGMDTDGHGQWRSVRVEHVDYSRHHLVYTQCGPPPTQPAST